MWKPREVLEIRLRSGYVGDFFLKPYEILLSLDINLTAQEEEIFTIMETLNVLEKH